MYQEILQSIEGIELYPLISLFIFLVLFAGITLWIFKLDKKYIKKMEALPLEDTGESGINKPAKSEN
jgi:cytochrome c oxidase cbb3-type subunit 4